MPGVTSSKFPYLLPSVSYTNLLELDAPESEGTVDMKEPVPLFHHQSAAGGTSAELNSLEEKDAAQLLEETLNKLATIYGCKFDDNRLIEIINNAQENEKHQKLFDITKEIMMLCNNAASRAQCLFRLISIIIRSNLPLKLKFVQLELRLADLFKGHSYSKLFSLVNEVNYFIHLGKSDYFHICASFIKSSMIVLARANKSQFLVEGGFSQSQKDLLNAKRSCIGYIEDFFGIKSRSIKICYHFGLIENPTKHC